MKLVVGLGNKGLKYKNTRHNAGFILLNKLSYKNKCLWKLNKRLDCYVCKVSSDLMFAKPNGFMNNSGLAVAKIYNFYKFKPYDLIVVHDDVDLDFGQIKIQSKKGSAGHKGVQSIIESIGSNEFYRVRVGVGRPPNKDILVENWVLGKFSKKELSRLKEEVFLEVENKLDKLYTLSY